MTTHLRRTASLVLTTLLLCATVLITKANAQIIDAQLASRAAELRDAALDDPLAYELVASLTTEVGARFAGSPGDIKAVNWAVEKLNALGFDNVRQMPVTVPQWIRGQHTLRVVSPAKQPLIATLIGGSIGTDDIGITATVIRVESLDALRALDDADVAGKVVFVDQQMPRARDGSGYGETVGIRVVGPSVSAAKGALAHLIRSVGTDNHRTGHTGTLRYDPTLPKIPALALSGPDADMLARQVDSGEPVEVFLQSDARYLADTISYNVIGEITGGKKRDEIILLGAHLDSWDEGTGAHDDGAGVAIVMAAAKLIGNLKGKPQRTLRVVLFANEEFGLSGARQYLTDHASTVDQHIIGLEADLGAGPVWQFASQVAEDALPIVDEIHGLLTPLNIERGNNQAFGGADIGPLRSAGMPVFGIRQDASLYFDYHHTPGDTLDKIVPKDLAQNVAVYATAAFIAASIEEDFGRLPKPQ